MDYTDLQVCRLCIQHSCPLIPVQAYLLPTYLQFNASVGLPTYLCCYCKTLISRTEKFITRARHASNLLTILYENGDLNLEYIKHIDTKELSNINYLSIKNYEANHFDKVFSENEPDVINDTENVDSIKMESEEDPIKFEDSVDSRESTPEPVDSRASTPEPVKVRTKKKKAKKKSVDVDITSSDDEELEQVLSSFKTKKDAEEDTDSDEEYKDILEEIKNEVTKDETAKKDAFTNLVDSLKTKPKEVKLKKLKKVNLSESKQKTEKYNELLSEYYKITNLNTLEEQKEGFLRKKQHPYYVNAPLKCDLCYRGYVHEKPFELHMMKHSERSGKFACQVCKLHYFDKKSLNIHYYSEHRLIYSCKLCTFEATMRYAAKQHVTFHQGTRFSCDKCDMTFSRKSNYQKHYRLKHVMDNVCGLCGYSFIGKIGMATHRAVMHKFDDLTVPEDGPMCVSCDVRFLNQAALDAHMNVSPRHAKYTSTAYEQKYKFKKEKKCRNNPKRKRLTPKIFSEPVPCEQCGQEMTSALEYHRHFIKFHRNVKRTWYPDAEYRNLCDVCGKMLKDSQIKDHMTEHDEATMYKCDVCLKTFNSSSSYKIHTLLHKGMRYECPICGKMFNHFGNRERHVKFVHTDVRNFKCDLCDKTFKNSCSVKLHQTHVHQRKPWPKRTRNERQGQGDANTNKRKRQNEEDWIDDVAD